MVTAVSTGECDAKIARRARLANIRKMFALGCAFPLIITISIKLSKFRQSPTFLDGNWAESRRIHKIRARLVCRVIRKEKKNACSHG